MAEPGPPNSGSTEATPPPAGPRSKDEIALELMKFIAATTGIGKSGQPSTGFSAKPTVRSPEEHAEALLELYERCRRAVNQGG
jgi:hypothetical protein